ncbi:MAG: tetratricopeptide repeat protein [Bacteroidia bacterium]|nr:tetratricopeptide repeat protein [Bacteroidia bacterium]
MDSVKNVYSNSKDQYVRARAMNWIITHYQQQYDSAYYYLQVAVQGFKLSNYKFGEAWAKHSFGISCVENAHYEDAKKYLNEAIAEYASMGNDSMIGKAKIRVAFTHYSQGNYEASIKTYLEAVESAQKAKDLYTEAWAYNLLGLVLYNKPTPDNKLALEYYNKSLDIHRKKNNIQGFGMVMMRMGSAYSRLGDDANAIYYLNRAMALGDSLEQGFLVKWTLSAYSKYYMERKDYLKSNEIEKRAKYLSLDAGDFPGVIISYKNIASNNYNLKDYKLALVNIDSALYYSTKHGVLQKIDEIYEIKSDIHHKLGQTEEALVCYKRSVALRDSLFSIKNNNNINELQTRFETNEKEKAIELLNSEKESERKVRNVLLGAFIVALLLIALIVFALIKINKARKEIQHQKKIVDQKQKEVMDSINYATRIQKALMPTEKYIEKILNKNRKN